MGILWVFPQKASEARGHNLQSSAKSEDLDAERLRTGRRLGKSHGCANDSNNNNKLYDICTYLACSLHVHDMICMMFCLFVIYIYNNSNNNDNDKDNDNDNNNNSNNSNNN